MPLLASRPLPPCDDGHRDLAMEILAFGGLLRFVDLVELTGIEPVTS